MTTKELFNGLLTLTLAGLGTLSGDIKHFYLHHSFAFHAAMSIAQWLCYVSSFGVGVLTMYNHFKQGRNGYK